MDSLVLSGLAIVVLLLALLGMGLSIFAAMMTTAIFGLAFINDFSFARIGLALQTIVWRYSTGYEIAALPMFVWMAELLFRSRLSEEIFRGLAPWLNWLPGRLLHVNVLGCGIFGSVSGSSAATCATIAKIALPELAKRGYDEKVALGSLAGAGTLGILIPPSITMVVYSIAAEVSLIRLFLAGFLPGLLVMVLYHGYIVIWALIHRRRMPPADPDLPLREKIAALRDLIPCASLIMFVFVALLFGWVTPNECAAWGVVGAVIIVWWSGALTWRTFWSSAVGAAKLTCMIMIIVAAASFLSVMMAYTGIPKAMAAWVAQLQVSPYALILILTLFYIVLGTALDGISLILLTMPVVLPIVGQAGFDLIWFGIFMILVIEMAEVSPPVGFCLFVLQTMSGRDSWFVSYAALPFFLLLVVSVAIITAFPSVVMVVPNLAFT
jgi:tripartite ATP-independent transporter DctM subunit